MVEFEAPLTYESLTFSARTDDGLLLEKLSATVPFRSHVLVKGADPSAGNALFMATAGIWTAGEGRRLGRMRKPQANVRFRRGSLRGTAPPRPAADTWPDYGRSRDSVRALSASAVLLILELSDPDSGLFRMPHEGFDGLVGLLTKGPEMAAELRDVGSKFTAEFHRTWEPWAQPVWVAETLAAVVV